jgi:hypothetical protein
MGTGLPDGSAGSSLSREGGNSGRDHGAEKESALRGAEIDEGVDGAIGSDFGGKMKEIRCASWEQFKKEIDDLRKEYGNGEGTGTKVSRLLYRGQASAEWPLRTTLERASSQEFDLEKYILFANRGLKEIESFTGKNWEIKNHLEVNGEFRNNRNPLHLNMPNYDYHVYLRHHRFPSPLLDWTESPYIAAFFACSECHQNKDSAVYCFFERPFGRKSTRSGDATIIVQGPYVRTHNRHFAQKSWYTIAAKWDSARGPVFCSHEEVFQRDDPKQDLLFKLILPAAERITALRELNDFNINYFTLFQDEESLIRAIAAKVFDLGDIGD